MSKNIAIIYGSASGNVEYVCQEVAEYIKDAEQLGLTPTLYRAETVPTEIIDTTQQFILAVSTWGHGIPNPYMDAVIAYISKNDMNGKLASFIGLGDRKYEPVLFNEGINITERAWVDSGGDKLGETLKINDLPHNQMHLVKEWFEKTFGVHV